MAGYLNVSGSTSIRDVPDAATRLGLVAYDDMIVHQLDTDELFIYNIDTLSWELAAGPSTVIQLGVSNGLELNTNILSLNLANATNAGAMSSADFVKLSTLANFNFSSEVFTLTSTNISQKKITLSQIPLDPEGLSFLPDGGIPQRYGIDFTIVGNDIIWSGMGLDGFLEENDVIRVSY